MTADDLALVPEAEKRRVREAITAAGHDGVGWDRLTETVDLERDAIDAALRALKHEGEIRYSAIREGYVPAAAGGVEPTPANQREALRVLARRDDLLGAIAVAAYDHEYGPPAGE